jgi:hypothetical protein
MKAIETKQQGQPSDGCGSSSITMMIPKKSQYILIDKVRNPRKEEKGERRKKSKGKRKKERKTHLVPIRYYGTTRRQQTQDNLASHQ